MQTKQDDVRQTHQKPPYADGLSLAIHEWLMEQQYNGECLLHAAVCCDYAGSQNFKKALAKVIAEYE